VKNCCKNWYPQGCSNRQANTGYAHRNTKQWKYEQNKQRAEEAFDEVIPHAIQMSCHSFANKTFKKKREYFHEN
jgi:hypothetical protein